MSKNFQNRIVCRAFIHLSVGYIFGMKVFFNQNGYFGLVTKMG